MIIQLHHIVPDSNAELRCARCGLLVTEMSRYKVGSCPVAGPNVTNRASSQFVFSGGAVRGPRRPPYIEQVVFDAG